jgi:hypothetical protein
MKELVLLNPYKKIVEIVRAQVCHICDYLIPVGCKAIENRYNDAGSRDPEPDWVTEYVCQDCNKLGATGSIVAHRVAVAWLAANPCEGHCVALHLTTDMKERPRSGEGRS